MGSDVVFDNLYLDKCLRFGWCLDIIMLLLLGVASLMCRSDSIVFELPRSRVWWEMIPCHPIFDLPYIRCQTGAYFVSGEIHGSSWICTFIITYWIHTETLTCSLLFHHTSVGPLWIHLAKSSRLGIGLLSCFIFWDTSLGCVDLIWITEITCSMIDDSRLPDLRPIIHLMLYLGHISVMDEIYRSWWSWTLIPICKMCTETTIYSLSSRWFLSGAFREPSN